jgi:NADH-quinone oxidoreductase subunit K
MIVPFSHVLILAGLLFLMGMVCMVARRSLIMILLGVEIMLNAAAIVLVGSSLL